MAVINKKISAVISIGFSFAILLFLGASLEWKEVAVILKEVKISHLLLWFLLFLVALVMRTYRWKLLFPASMNPSSRHLYDSLNIGNLATMILPLRAGELIRPILFTKLNGVSFGKSFASVVIERVFDVCGMFLIFLYAVKGVHELPEMVLLGAKMLSIVAGVIILAMLVSYAIPAFILSLIDSLGQKLKKFIPEHFVDSCSSMIKEFISGLSGIENLVQLVLVSVTTLLIWILYVLGFQVIFISLGGADNSFAVAAVCCVFVSLFIAAPSAPGFLGTFQLGCVAALTGVFAYSEEFSFAFSIVAHSLQFIGTVLVGFLSMFLQGLSLSSLQKK
jgi:glycosyltransferase 2 family protein